MERVDVTEEVARDRVSWRKIICCSQKKKI